LDYLEVEDAVLGGISMGAATTIAFCCRWPTRVRAATLIRPAWLDKPHPECLKPLERIGELLTNHDVHEAKRRFLESREYQLLRSQSPSAAAQALDQFNSPRAAERASRLVRIPGSAPISDWHETAVCTMPVLIVGNDRDPFHPLHVARQWAERLPHAQFAHVPSALEEPQGHTQQLQLTIREFLA
jgi:pimeloyl-ACP methyl ester carboxylesterase